MKAFGKKVLTICIKNLPSMKKYTRWVIVLLAGLFIFFLVQKAVFKKQSSKTIVFDSVNLDSTSLEGLKMNITSVMLDNDFEYTDFYFGIEKELNQSSPILFNGAKLSSKLLRKYSSGKIKLQANCIEGFINGPVKEYDSLGDLRRVCYYTIEKHFSDGKVGSKLDSIKLFFRGNRVKSKQNYEDGKLNGLITWFHENGKISSKGEYFKGKKVGDHISYYSNGEIESVRSYLSIPAGVADGDFIEYFEDGSIKYKAVYVDGFPEGQEISYHAKNQIEYSNTWLRGKLVGKSVRYFENGRLAHSGVFNLKGEETGEWKEYYENGKIRLLVIFKDGKILEQHYYSSRDGNYDLLEGDDLRRFMPGVETRY